MKRKGERYTAPKDRLPEGDGFGKKWAAPIGTMFNVNGAEVRSILGFNNDEPDAVNPLVVVDAGGKWNRGAADTLALSMRPDTAREMAGYLLEAADAAERDVETWKARQ